jgi:hypothetical protein
MATSYFIPVGLIHIKKGGRGQAVLHKTLS